ncbi:MULTISPECIES: SDR family oxidoreductase [Acinetobacter]|jgi:NAD(P)H dehydrogenase (quinone)|uniref:SDR family oxidoreductase n=2 Tax=Acinetobacter TaxID=469 RepID=A0A4Q7AS47_9GAMM|nr:MULTISPECIES: SDR family oxidoreductase [Acinetobacter]MCW8040489.1 SDR family oxidoreductase [Acinetobacter entericus]RZG64375.1 SDR family oxidoreductase [Acinetobacter bouvetii]TCB73957.1 SDR family oxidoreductase [Acinetobacter sp. ANC 4177]
MKIAITGATGQLGQLVIQALLKDVPASQIIALVRSEAKAASLKQQGVELRHFDYDAPETLAPALQGVDKLLLISANEIGRRTPQHKAVIEAAKQAGVPYIAYTSLLRADTSPLGLAQEHRETEALIQDSGLAYTFLRNNWYSDNYLATVQQIAESGVLYGASQDGKISSASREDYAEAAAKVLASAGHENKTYELAGSESFTKADLAQFIGQTAHKSITYQNLSADDLRQGLTQAGLPTHLIDVIVDADVQTAKGAMYSDSKDLEQLIGRKTTSIQDAIKAAL